MSISGISTIRPITTITPTTQMKNTNGALFQNILQQIGNGVESMNQNQIQNQQSVEKILTGQSTNVQNTLVNLEKAQLQMNLAVQIRDKLTTAYNTVMSMQI